MKVTKHNCEQVAKWLLQCNHEDFNGPIDVIAEHYLELDKVYTDREEKQERDHTAGTFHMTRLARHLYEHLNHPAKTMLQAKIAILE